MYKDFNKPFSLCRYLINKQNSLLVHNKFRIVLQTFIYLIVSCLKPSVYSIIVGKIIFKYLQQVNLLYVFVNKHIFFVNDLKSLLNMDYEIEHNIVI